MRTFRGSAITIVAVYRATAFNVYPRQFQSSLEPASHHSFCSRTSSYASSAISSRRPSSVRCRDRRASRADRSTGAASLRMFDATDLFQLQQWAGDISATEVRRCSFSSEATLKPVCTYSYAPTVVTRYQVQQYSTATRTTSSLRYYHSFQVEVHMNIIQHSSSQFRAG